MINETYHNVDEDSRIRIIHIDDPIYFWVDIDTKTAVPNQDMINNLINDIDHKRIIRIPDPYFRSISDESLSETQIRNRDQDWTIFEEYMLGDIDLFLNKRTRVERLKIVSDAAGVKEIKIRRILTRYWQRGMNKNALIPDYDRSGAKGSERKPSEKKIGRKRASESGDDEAEGIIVDSEIKIQIETIINQTALRGSRHTIRDMYLQLLRNYYSDRYYKDDDTFYALWDESRIPSYNQFYYWYQRIINGKGEYEFRKGTNEYELKHRPLTNTSQAETSGPGSRFQVDATVGDVYLVSSLDRSRIIGRPVIYAITDVYSRILTGLYIGLEGPSWAGAMLALDNMVADKQEFCAQYGIEISPEDWPCSHLPETILADRGEFEGYSVENLINNLNVKIENTPPYRGDLKGIVERRFKTINERIKRNTPGAVLKELRNRGDRDYRQDAVLDLKEFTRIVLYMVLEHNYTPINKYEMEKEMITDGLTPTPINLWNWGLANRKGRLRTVDRDIFRLNVLPHANATITRTGIRFKSLYYGSQKAIDEQWYLKLKNKSIRIVYDPRNMNNIFIPDAKGKNFEVCSLLDISQQYSGINLEEILFQEARRRELEKLGKRDVLQKHLNTEEEINRIVSEAKKKSSASRRTGDSKAKRVRDIKFNRSEEKSMIAQTKKYWLAPDHDNYHSPGKLTKLPISDSVRTSEEEQAHRADDPRQKRLEKIRKMREKEKDHGNN